MNLIYKNLLLAVLLTFTLNAGAQNFKFSRRIIATDTITDEGVTFAASSDDAEQENNEIDALFDDDIDAGWEGEPEDQNILTAGLRFQNIFIPRGAIIDSAFIIVHSHEAKTPEDVARITIAGDANPNPPTFTEDSLIDARMLTETQLLWEVAAEWGLWSEERTLDIAAVVQELVDNPEWQPGNAMAFLLLGEDQGPSEVENAREFESFENIADPEDGGDGQNYPDRVPELVVFWSFEGSAEVDLRIVATDTVTDEGVTFAASSDDAEQENNEIDALFDDDIDAGWEGEPEDQNILTAGLRFQNVVIPQGAIIDSAYIEVVSHEAKTPEDVARITIAGDANPNPPTFTEDSLIDARMLTEAQLLWEVTEEWGLWSTERTVDISPIVQELVDNPEWQLGNAMAFILLGEDQGPSEVENAREFESYENIADPEDGGDGQNYPDRVPRLRVFYSAPNTATSVFNVFTPKVESLKVYPNPSSNEVTIELKGEGEAAIRVFSANGQLMRALDGVRDTKVMMNISDLNNGVYFIQAKQDNKLYVQKLIVE